MNNFITVEQIWHIVTGLLMALLGGLTRVLYNKDKKKLKLTKIFSELFISAFAGFLAFFLCQNLGFVDWSGLFCGIAGWGGSKAIDHIFEFGETLASKKLNIKFEGKKDDNKGE